MTLSKALLTISLLLLFQNASGEARHNEYS